LQFEVPEYITLVHYGVMHQGPFNHSWPGFEPRLVEFDDTTSVTELRCWTYLKERKEKLGLQTEAFIALRIAIGLNPTCKYYL